MTRVARSFRSMWVIFKHEFSLFFMSPIVYLIGAVWLFFAGGFFAVTLSGLNQFGGEPTMVGVLSPIVFLMIFIAPALTMRLLAEEVRTGTHELLFTAPLRDWEIVVGKWLAAWAVFTIFMLITLIYPAILLMRGNPEVGLIISGYLGLWLMAGATLAIGVFASALTQYQLVSFMIAMGIMLFLWLAQLGGRLVNSPAFAADFFSELSFITHYQSLVQRALIDPVDLAYFIGLIILFLFLATQVLSTRRLSA
ncbi:MAG: ABC transporter permease [Anaerolineae bacterium]